MPPPVNPCLPLSTPHVNPNHKDFSDLHSWEKIFRHKLQKKIKLFLGRFPIHFEEVLPLFVLLELLGSWEWKFSHILDMIFGGVEL